MAHGTKEQIAAQRKRYKAKYPERVKAEKIRYKEKYPDKSSELSKLWYSRLRLRVLQHYSKNEHPVCASCGESHLEFLEIDHINGGGKSHRKTLTVGLYRWLELNGYPEGYRVLCSNCNIKRVKVDARIRGENGTKEQKKWYRKNNRRKMMIFEHYKTEDIPSCSCCGITDTDVLCIDHINGDGAEHRKEIGNTLYLWLRRNNYPPGFRILCHNCNQSLGSRGYCPHTKVQSIQPSTIPATEPQ